jgi:iron(III) transport system permease protein
VIGVPLGFVFARTTVPRLLKLALLIPLVTPPYVLALVWIFATDYSAISYSLPGAALVLGIAFFPLLMLASEAGFKRVDASLEEAGMMVANPRQVFFGITLPLVGPVITAAALLVFVLAVSEFGVPGLLRTRVFTTEVFTAFAALYDFGRATALTLPLLAVALIAAVCARVVVGDRLLVQNTAWRPRVLTSRRWRAIAICFASTVILLTAVLPIAVLSATAQRLVENAVPSWTAIRTSVLLSLLSACLIVVVGVLLGYARGRAQSYGRFMTDLILITAFAVPSTVVGVGIIGLWNRPAIPASLYASATTIVFGYIARFLPVAALILSASVRQVRRHPKKRLRSAVSAG